MKSVKLNLGSGPDYRKGWINLDIDPNTNPDIIHDLTEMLPYKDDTVDEIALIDVIEHQSSTQAKKLIRECYRVLKPKAKLTLRVPNVFQIFEQFYTDPEVALEFIYGDSRSGADWDIHKHGYTHKTLHNTLKLCGFGDISINQQTTNFFATAIKSRNKLPSPKPLIILQSPDWGGAEQWISSLVQQWGNQGYFSICYTNSTKLRRSFRDSKSKTYDIPFILDINGNWKGLVKSIALLPFAIYWYSLVLYRAKRQGVNCVVLTNFSEKLLVSWLALFFNIPTIWFEYGPMDQVFKHNFYLPKLAYRLSKQIPERVLTISQNTKKNLLTTARISSAKLKLIYPGVTIPDSTSRLSQPNVGCLSRLTPEKGQRILIKAWPQVLKKVPQAKLHIAGRGPDEKSLKKLVLDLHLSNSVEFHGFIKNKSNFYESLSLFVFPSMWKMEGFGLVQVEAMSFGIPVISFNHGPSPEIIYPNTLLVKKQNLDDLAKTIIHLLNSPKTLRKFGYEARKRTEKQFNLKIQSQKVLEEISDVVKQNS